MKKSLETKLWLQFLNKDKMFHLINIPKDTKTKNINDKSKYKPVTWVIQ